MPSSGPSAVPLTWLYVPADRPDRIGKALGGEADMVIVDLEDAVAPENKGVARAGVVALLATPQPRVEVRVNDVRTPYGQADLHALGTLLHGSGGVRVPKVESADEVRWIADAVPGVPLRLIIESALGLERAFEIATASPAVAGIGLGEADLRADLGVTDEAGLAWARSRIVVAARAAGLPAPAQSVYANVRALLEAFPRLERLEVRGGTGLELRPVRHESLRVLRFETGGLPAEVVRAVGACDLLALERLDLWLGVQDYGGNATVADLAPILSGERLPTLRHLGLQDSEIQDEIVAAVASAPVVARLESLALSMGVLTDAGAEALLGGQPLTHLHTLDLHHHFLTDAMAARVAEALPGVEVDLSRREKPVHDWRYVAVSE
ncbi:STM4015 family protein [Microbispora rosea]|uniref:STM4015 family protein n=1 Tax=Microbispora rosea TaxID=58117 RepID=UPI0034456699